MLGECTLLCCVLTHYKSLNHSVSTSQDYMYIYLYNYLINYFIYLFFLFIYLFSLLVRQRPVLWWKKKSWEDPQPFAGCWQTCGQHELDLNSMPLNWWKAPRSLHHAGVLTPSVMETHTHTHTHRHPHSHI